MPQAVPSNRNNRRREKNAQNPTLNPISESTLVCVCFVFDKHEKRTENKIVLDGTMEGGAQNRILKK